VSALAHANDRAFKFLNTLPVTFLDADMDTHLIPGFQIGDVCVLGRIKVFIQVNHFHLPFRILCLVARGEIITCVLDWGKSINSSIIFCLPP
jgi:hypothetical protein